ncbi:FAD-binding oxidoreductase [Nisaea sp.]|uniref:NAD(P)/FAD-dependent oxidoreductase n=1 Tax=Nisaea sp. TaxID=2024842 RepID=UPI0032980090
MNTQFEFGEHAAPQLAPFAADAKLPKAVDVVVIGGGIAGVSTALALAEKGVSTLLCEKGVIAGEQSSRNWGWVRKSHRDPREMPLMLESERLWRGMSKRVDADVGYHQCGIVYLCPDERVLERREAWHRSVEEFQLDSRMATSSMVEELAAGSTVPWKGALYTQSDGRAEPQLAVPAMARAAQKFGAHVLTRCAVRGIETEAGRISGVVTELGTVRCGSVVLAGGIWSSLFCRNIGVRLPQLKVLASVMRLAPFEGGPTVSTSGAGFAFRKRADGGYTVANGSANTADIVPDSFRYMLDFLPAFRVERHNLMLRLGQRFVEEARIPNRWKLDAPSPFEMMRVTDPAPVPSVMRTARENLDRAFPIFKGKPVKNSWAGLIDATPDAIPVISPVGEVPGLHIATGFSGHGFGIGPGAGQLMANLVLGDTPVVDPSPFRLSRFSDGSGLHVTSGI